MKGMDTDVHVTPWHKCRKGRPWCQGGIQHAGHWGCFQVWLIAGNLQIIAPLHSVGMGGCSLEEGLGAQAIGGVPDLAQGWKCPDHNNILLRFSALAAAQILAIMHIWA